MKSPFSRRSEPPSGIGFWTPIPSDTDYDNYIQDYLISQIYSNFLCRVTLWSNISWTTPIITFDIAVK